MPRLLLRLALLDYHCSFDLIRHAFFIAAGTTVALCGPSGSGKSTIMGLITRFYDPQQGQVRVVVSDSLMTT